jgi:hypothetical protein
MDILYVGLDWGSENHAVCVMRGDGSVQAERVLRNDGRFIEQLLQLVGGKLDGVRVAVESRDLPIVDMLVEAGCAVFTVNPKQADRFRDRYSAGGAKDDRRDARVLASALRTDEAAFRRVCPASAATALLHVRVRAVSDLEAQFRGAANQLRACLLRYFPALLTLCDAADERWMWRLLAKAPDPEAAAKLTHGALQKLLTSCQVRRLDAAGVRDVLRAERLQASPGVVQGCVEQVQRLVERLELLRTQKVRAEKLRDDAVRQLDREQRESNGTTTDVAVVASMPGAGRVVTSVLLAEAGELVQARNLAAVRAIGGVAPVTKRSGKSSLVTMRRSRSIILVNALFHAARVAAMTDPRFRALLASARARGQSHARALRGVADRWLDTLFALLRQRTTYDASRWQPRAAA